MILQKFGAQEFVFINIIKVENICAVYFCGMYQQVIFSDLFDE